MVAGSESRCRSCGAEVLWAVCGTQRIPLDPRLPVYVVVATAGTPSVVKASSVPGMNHAALVDHRRLCPGARHGIAVDPKSEEE